MQPRAASTRQSLVDAAVRLFAEKGYLQTTPREIAEAAEVTTGAFYYHFSCKEELADSIIEQVIPDVAHTLDAVSRRPGIANVITAEFALVDITNRDKTHWVGFHLGMAIGHLSTSARQAHRERVGTFASVVTRALPVSQLRDGITRRQAGELLWIASTGARLMSDALEETGPALFTRLAMAWKSALRTIVRDDILTELEDVVDATAARYGASATSRVA